MGFWNYYYHHQNWRDVLPRNAVFFFFNSHTTFVQKRQDKNVFSHYNTLKTTFHSLFFIFYPSKITLPGILGVKVIQILKILTLEGKSGQFTFMHTKGSIIIIIFIILFLLSQLFCFMYNTFLQLLIFKCNGVALTNEGSNWATS